jgi:hypothetical protein
MDKATIKVVAKREIIKYNQGDTPGVDAPFEVLVKEDVFEGEQAVKILKQMGGYKDAVN